MSGTVNFEIKKAPDGRYAGMIIRNKKPEKSEPIKTQNPVLEAKKGRIVDVYA